MLPFPFPFDGTDPGGRCSGLASGTGRPVAVGLALLPGQFVVYRLAASGVGITNVAAERFLVLEEALIRLELDVAVGSDRPVVRQANLLCQTDVDFHRIFLFKGVVERIAVRSLWSPCECVPEAVRIGAEIPAPFSEPNGTERVPADAPRLPILPPPKEPIIIITTATHFVPARRRSHVLSDEPRQSFTAGNSEIASICDGFEAELRAGKKPKIEDFLGDVSEPARSALLRDLQAIEEGITEKAELACPADTVEVVQREHAELVVSQSTRDMPGQRKDAAAEDTPVHPALIGKYRIEKVLGRGSFGTVYQGFDSVLKRMVAIKVPHAHMVSRPEDVELYLQEGQVVASLDHPHIVPVFEAERTADGLCYVVSKVHRRNEPGGTNQAKPPFASGGRRNYRGHRRGPAPCTSPQSRA